MNARLLFLVCGIGLCSLLATAQEPQSYSKEFKNALRCGAKARITVQVVDESGCSVTESSGTDPGFECGTRYLN